MNKELTIAKVALRNTQVLFLVLVFVNISLIFLYAAIWPSIQSQTESFNQLIATMPETFLKAFNIGGSLAGGYETLLVTKQFSLMIPVFLLLLANGIAGNSIAGEIDRDTILLHHTQPVSRATMYWSKYCAGLLWIVLFSLTIVTAIPLGLLFNATLVASHFYVYTVQTFLFGVTLYSIAFLVSSFSSAQGKVSAITVSIFLISYLINLVAQLSEQLVNLKYFSLLYYFGPSTEFINYSIPVFLAVTITCAIAGRNLFVQRDIAIR